MILYGFELEGFYSLKNNISIPPESYPTDGFPGLVEMRTTGGKGLYEAYFDLLEKVVDYDNVDYMTYYHKFKTDELRSLRNRHVTKKDPCDIRNLYGKKPRDLKGGTIASLQINVSNRLSGHRNVIDKNGKIVGYVPDTYSLIDVGKIVSNLDDTFRNDISSAGRQPGEYAIKDGYRLEYRSLPNNSVVFDIENIKPFLQKIKKAVES